MKRFFVFLLLFIVSSLFSKPVQAVVDPLNSPNNHFGIHVLEFDDLEAAASLVNSHGGQWGYITLVICQNDLNLDKWQTIFNELRRLKLIPLVRLATTPQNSYWQKPEIKDIDQWVNFLTSLNWVVKNRYLILFNEPNHSHEWGNQLEPQVYADLVKQFHTQLKKASPDFFILPAALDTAAPNSDTTMKATDYWQKMYQSHPDIFTLFDGWNSHSYPNPNFSGPLSGTGFGSIRSFQEEINFLSQFGLPKNLPIFITETGWIHQNGQVLGIATDSDKILSYYYTQAFQTIWNKTNNLVAVTPFVLNYPQPPFDQFAWQIPDSSDFYPHYYAVQNLPKKSGQPIQVHQSQLINHNLPNQLIDDSRYGFNLTFKNTGQSIWNNQQFGVNLISNLPSDYLSIEKINKTEPFDQAEISLTLNTPANPSTINLKAQLTYQNKPFGEIINKTIQVVPPPQLTLKAKLLYKLSSSGGYRLLIYDQQNNLIKTFDLNLPLIDSLKLYHLVPNQSYRFVLLKPFYLPRQIITILPSDHLELNFKPLLPFDFNQSGHFSAKDILYSFTHPSLIFKLFL